MRTGSAAPPYVRALDWVRALTIAAVVGVHAVRLAVQAPDPLPEGAVQLLLQFGRESFMVVTGFVLWYRYRSPVAGWLAFWRRRFADVGCPYVFWLAAFVALGGPLALPGMLTTLFRSLPTGDGHLYYLVITLQFYPAFPLVRGLLRRGTRYRLLLAVAAALWQLVVFSVPVFAGTPWSLTLVDYVGFFVLGGLLADVWPDAANRLSAWWVVAGWVAAAGAILAAYQVQVASGAPPAAAATVFQPTTVPYALATVALLVASGRWYERSASAPLLTTVTALADASFGIYLMHPIWVHGALWIAERLMPDASPWLVAGGAWAVGLGASFVVVRLFQLRSWTRRLVGAPRQARVPATARVPSASAG